MEKPNSMQSSLLSEVQYFDGVSVTNVYCTSMVERLGYSKLLMASRDKVLGLDADNGKFTLEQVEVPGLTNTEIISMHAFPKGNQGDVEVTLALAFLPDEAESRGSNSTQDMRQGTRDAEDSHPIRNGGGGGGARASLTRANSSGGASEVNSSSSHNIRTALALEEAGSVSGGAGSSPSNVSIESTGTASPAASGDVASSSSSSPSAAASQRQNNTQPSTSDRKRAGRPRALATLGLYSLNMSQRSSEKFFINEFSCLDLDYLPFGMAHLDVGTGLVGAQSTRILLVGGTDNAIHAYKHDERRVMPCDDSLAGGPEADSAIVTGLSRLDTAPLAFKTFKSGVDLKQTSLAIGGADGSLRIFRQTNHNDSDSNNHSIHFEQDPHNCALLQFDSPVVSIDVLYPPTTTASQQQQQGKGEQKEQGKEKGIEEEQQQQQQEREMGSEDTFEPCSSPSLVVGTSVDGVFVFDYVNTKHLQEIRTLPSQYPRPDCVMCVHATDFNFDGHEEIFLGTYGNQMLVLGANEVAATPSNDSVIDSADKTTSRTTNTTSSEGYDNPASDEPTDAAPVVSSTIVGIPARGTTEHEQQQNEVREWKHILTRDFPGALFAVNSGDLFADGSIELVVNTSQGVHIMRPAVDDVVDELIKTAEELGKLLLQV